MLRVGALLLALACAACAPAPVPEETRPDSSTPRGALLVLEDAYRARDLEAAVRAKDFRMEARLMLEKLRPDVAPDAETIDSTARTLELAYRAQIEGRGFPDFTDVATRIVDEEPMSEDVVVVTEEAVYPDSTRSLQRILVGKTEDGWKVLNVVDGSGGPG